MTVSEEHGMSWLGGTIMVALGFGSIGVAAAFAGHRRRARAAAAAPTVVTMRAKRPTYPFMWMR